MTSTLTTTSMLTICVQASMSLLERFDQVMQKAADSMQQEETGEGQAPAAVGDVAEKA